jgi:hypothetical protein
MKDFKKTLGVVDPLPRAVTKVDANGVATVRPACSLSRKPLAVSWWRKRIWVVASPSAASGMANLRVATDELSQRRITGTG